MPLLESTRIVAAEVANGFVLAALTFEVYEVYKPASVYEHMKEQTQPCQHRGPPGAALLRNADRVVEYLSSAVYMRM